MTNEPRTQQELDRIAATVAFWREHGVAWAVVENAGYQGEYTWPRLFRTYQEADAWADRKYSEGERETLHVDIAHWQHDGCGDDGGFWSYDH